jgi:DNA ligase-1
MIIGKDKSRVKEDLKAIGDLAEIGKVGKKNQKNLDSDFGIMSKKLTILSVYNSFVEIAQYSGLNTTKKRLDKIQELLRSGSDIEVKYLIRLLSGKLRINVSDSTVLLSIGRALCLREFYIGAIGKPDEEQIISAGKRFKKHYFGYPIIDKLLIEMIRGGEENCKEVCGVQPGVPLFPMLAKPAKTIEKIRSRVCDSKLTAEYKYDGERGQIHKRKNGTISIFSRNAEDSTAKFADLAQLFLENSEAESFIVDSEIVAFDTVNKKILPFQVLMHRPKKGSDVDLIQVCVFCFDILYLNGNSLIQMPLIERSQLLRETIRPVENKLHFAVFLDSELDGMGDFFQEAKDNKTEGLMVKTLDGEYEPGKRSQNWAKLKKDYISSFNEQGDNNVADSIDVVIVGGKWGKGKRTDLFGSFYVAIYDDLMDKFQTVCKLGTGLSDECLQELSNSIRPFLVDRPDINVEYSDDFDGVYVEPKICCEVKCADFSLSPKYPAAMDSIHEGNGISLRFPRFIRIREDKSIYQCTTTHQLVQLYKDQ